MTWTFTFLRHAESVGNAQGIRQGQGDLPLTDAGRTAAQTLAQHWRSAGLTFDALITSPLQRARETAHILAQALNLPAPEEDPLLMERDIGSLTLQPAATVPPTAAGFLSLYDPVGGTGESIWDLYVRAGQAVAGLTRRPPGRYLVVTHGMLLNMMLYALLGIAPQPNFYGPLFVLPNLGAAVVARDRQPSRHRWILVHLAGPECLPPAHF